MDYTKDKSVFLQACAEASSSGLPFRAEHHVTLGSRVVFLTAAEIADAQEKTAAELLGKSGLLKPVFMPALIQVLVGKGVLSEADIGKITNGG